MILKTRKFKKDKKGTEKADSYSTDLYQLAAYAFAQFEEPVWCRNVYIDPTTGAICEKNWSPEEVEAAFDVFQAICVIWRAEKSTTHGRCRVIEILPEQTTYQQLLDRVRSLARQLAEARAALAASEARENDLIDRMREGL